MKVLFISLSALEDLSEHNIYGDLLKVFKRHGHDVAAISPREKRAGLPTEYDTMGEFPVLRVAIGNVTKNGPVEKGLSLLGLPGRIERAIREHMPTYVPDLILFATPPTTVGGLVCRMKKRFCASTYLLLKDIFPQNSLDLGLLSTSGISGLIYRYFKGTERKTYEAADFIGCMSPANVEYLLDHERWLDSSRVEENPNSLIPEQPASTDRFEMRSEFGLPLDERVLVYGGNLGKPQAIDILIDALRTNESESVGHFVIAGSGTERGKLEAFFEECQPIHATLLPALSRERFDELLAAADAGLILLDYRFTIPNFPSRLLSYLQAGLPVVVCTDSASDMGAIAEENGFGVRCSSEDASNLLSGCSRLLEKDLQVMGSEGRRYLEREYTAERSYEIIVRHFV